jgi:hypothetical protein
MRIPRLLIGALLLWTAITLAHLTLHAAGHDALRLLLRLLPLPHPHLP